MLLAIFSSSLKESAVIIAESKLSCPKSMYKKVSKSLFPKSIVTGVSLQHIEGK